MLMSDVNEFCYLEYKKMLNDYLKKKMQQLNCI